MVQMNQTPTQETPRPLRIRFRKIGALQYISHLDLMRTMTRALVRAGLPVRYTSGYNPKPHLVFSAPLPVGTESTKEYLDIAVTAPVDLSAALTALNRSLPAELSADAIYTPERKFSEIAYARYEITIHTNGANAEQAELCNRLLHQKPLMIRKMTKSGARDTDVSASVASCEAFFREESGEIFLSLVLRADGGNFLKPDYLIGYPKSGAGILSGSPAEEFCKVMRKGFLTEESVEFD